MPGLEKTTYPQPLPGVQLVWAYSSENSEGKIGVRCFLSPHFAHIFSLTVFRGAPATKRAADYMSRVSRAASMCRDDFQPGIT